MRILACVALKKGEPDLGTGALPFVLLGENADVSQDKATQGETSDVVKGCLGISEAGEKGGY